ncbi:MAG: CoA pyrophosphatase [Deltaproteobacteria bacterium]|nr:CoA pyrophosphatase [Deltaproteobacteria bacterium]
MVIKQDFNETAKGILTKRVIKEIHSEDSEYIHSAVLIPIFKENGEYKVLLTKRTNIVEHHKGQVSFPGGVMDYEDDTFLDTALREAYEEIGLCREDVEILGQVDDRLTLITDFLIHPYVGVIPYPYSFRLNPREVERLVKVPLSVFIPGSGYGKTKSTVPGAENYEGITYSYKGDVIWGATAGIMENLVEILGEDSTRSFFCVTK